MTSKDIKHTPGPWSRNIRPVSKYPIVFAGRNTHVARVIADGLSESEAEANARLISAAPDLLKALNGVMDILELAESRASGNPEWSHIGPCVAVARAAIAKATRESE